MSRTIVIIFLILTSSFTSNWVSAKDSLSIIIEAFSGRENPAFKIDLNSDSPVVTELKALLTETKTNLLTQEFDSHRISRAEYQYGGILISDPDNQFLPADTLVSIKEDIIIVEHLGGKTIYENSYPKLTKAIIKYAYKQGVIDRRVAHHLNNK